MLLLVLNFTNLAYFYAQNPILFFKLFNFGLVQVFLLFRTLNGFVQFFAHIGQILEFPFELCYIGICVRQQVTVLSFIVLVFIHFAGLDFP